MTLCSPEAAITDQAKISQGETMVALAARTGELRNSHLHKMQVFT